MPIFTPYFNFSLYLSLNSSTFFLKVSSISFVITAPLVDDALPFAVPSPFGFEFGVSDFGAFLLSLIPPLSPIVAKLSSKTKSTFNPSVFDIISFT